MTERAMTTSWRFRCGLAMICAAVLSWTLVPLASAAGVSGARVASLAGILFISNKILLLAAIAVMGKPGFAELKSVLHSHVKSAVAWPVEVGIVRHRIGLVMFCVPLVAAILDHHMDIMAPQLAPYKIWIRVVGDLMLVTSIFLLGANFWDKLRALFIRDAKVAM